MQLLEETGIVAAVGKVNMDVNCPGYYGESTIKSIGETVRWIEASKRRFRSVFPILTPRFRTGLQSGTDDRIGRPSAEIRLATAIAFV